MNTKIIAGFLFVLGCIFLAGCPLDSENPDASLNIRINEANDTLLTFDSLAISLESKDGGFEQKVLNGKLTDPAKLLNIPVKKEVGDSFTVIIKGFNGGEQLLYKKIKVLGKNNTKETDLKDSLSIIASAPDILVTGDTSGYEGKELRFSVSASKVIPSMKGFYLKNSPTGAVLDTIEQPQGTSRFRWMPDYTQGRDEPYFITFGINMGGQSVERTVRVKISHVNLPPKIKAVPSQKLDEGEVLQFNVEAEDPDFDTLSFSVVDAPLGSTFANNVFRWQPIAGQSGNYTMNFFADDGKVKDMIQVNISVGDVDLPPEFSRPQEIRDTVINEGDTLELLFSAKDPDQTPISLSAKILPFGAFFEAKGPDSARFKWTPSFRSGRHEPYTLEVVASSGGLSTVIRMMIEVRDMELQTLAAPQFTNKTTPSPTKNLRPTWEWQASTAGTGEFRVRFDSGAFQETLDNHFGLSKDLSQGLHTLEVQEKNYDGNWSNSAVSKILIDATPPSLSVTSHDISSVIHLAKTNKLVLNGGATDGGGSGIALVTYAVSGKTTIPTANALGSDSWSTSEMTLANGGETVISITAEDRAGLKKTITVSVQVNIPLPALSFISPTPPDKFVTNKSTIKVVWQVDDKTFQEEKQSLIIGENKVWKSAKNAAGDSVSAVLTVYRVDPSIAFVNVTATGNNDGSSWKDAFKDLQNALKVWDSLVPDKRQLWVAKGTYYPQGNDTAAYTLKEGTHLYGGFSGVEFSSSARVIGERSTLNGNARIFVVKVRGKETLMDGFSVTGAVGNGFSVEDIDSLLVRNCVFYNNVALGDGGVGVLHNSKVVFHNCTFRENRASVGGGFSIYGVDRASRFINCTFEKNEANYGKDLYLVNYTTMDKLAILEKTVIDTTELGIQGIEFAEIK